MARWWREAYDGTHIQMDITHALSNALFRCQPFMLNFLSLTWHTTVLGYPKRRGALAVMTGGCVACTRKEKTRLSGPVGCWLPFILCNSRDAISIFKLHPLRGGLPLSVSFVVFISFQFALELVKILQKRRAVLCLFLMTVMYILKLWCHEGGRISRVRTWSQARL